MMKYRSVFDIMGPIMIGPSSSHTAGAARIGRVARSIFGREPAWIEILLYGSFAKTYKGHGTDVAIIGGILDYDTFDERIVEALVIAEKKGIRVSFFEEEAVTEHPNTVKIMMGDDENRLEIVGISIGGGKVEIIELDGFQLELSGNGPALLIVHNDRFGAIAGVSNILARKEVNIAQMKVSRKEKGKKALMTIEVDQNLTKDILDEVARVPNILQVTKIND